MFFEFNFIDCSYCNLMSNQKGMIMKTMKRISLLMAVAILFSLNVTMQISDGKVKELVFAPTPDQAMADGQCYLSLATFRCMCDMQVGYYCSAKCITPGQECEYYDDLEQ